MINHQSMITSDQHSLEWHQTSFYRFGSGNSNGFCQDLLQAMSGDLLAHVADVWKMQLEQLDGAKAWHLNRGHEA